MSKGTWFCNAYAGKDLSHTQIWKDITVNIRDPQIIDLADNQLKYLSLFILSVSAYFYPLDN